MDVTGRNDASAAMPSMLTTLRVAICCIGVVAAPANRVRAEAQTGIALVWHAPMECPSRAELLARIDTQLGERAAHAGTVKADATVTRRGNGGYVLALVLEDAAGRATRELAASSCDEVVQAVALLLAMAVDASSAKTTTTTGTSTRATGSTIENAPELNPPPPRWGFAVLTVLDLSSMPGAGLGLLGEAETQLGLWRFGFGAELFLPAEGRASQIPTATVDVSAIMARGTLCPTWSLGSVELGPCGLGEIGRSTGEANGIRKPVAGSALWLAAGGLAQARFGLGAGISLMAEAGAVFPGTRRRFLVLTEAGTVTVHRAAAASPRFSLGISYAFK